jgi:HK97 family phage major capsid protein
MAAKILELRQKRADLQKEGRDLAAKTTPTPEENARLLEVNRELDAVEAEIKTEEAVIEARKRFGSATGGDTEPRVEVGRELAADKPWAGAGEFFRAVHQAFQPGGAVDPRIRIGAAATGMSLGDPASAGTLVPAEISQSIYERMSRDPLNLLDRCDQYTVMGQSLTLKAPDDTDRSGGTIYGGVKAYWLGEADQYTGSKPKFRDLELKPKKLGVFIYETDELVEAQPAALEQLLTRAAARAIALKVGQAVIEGTGAKQPLGLRKAASCVSVAKETGQAAATVVAENIDKIWGRLAPEAKANSVWLVNGEVPEQLSGMQYGTGASGQLVYMPPGGLSAAPHGTIKGRPVIETTDYCEALGTEGDIILTDFSTYAAGLRGGIKTAMSMHLRFDYGEQCWRFTFYADGQPWLNTAIKPLKGTSGRTYGTSVVLATRA